MKLSSFKNKRILCWGYGIEIKSFITKIQKYSPKKITVVDQKSITYSNSILEENILDYKDEFDVIVKSAGISIYKENFKQLSKHIQYTTIPNIFFTEWSEHRKKNKKPITIGITGTKGKSTISSVLNHVLNSLGYRSVLAGNIGVSLLDVLSNLNADFIIVELSSYQVADLKISPNISLLNNLFPEHLDWHKSHENYFKDKQKLLELNKENSIKIDARKFDFKNLDFKIKNKCLQGEHNEKNVFAVYKILENLNIPFNKNIQKSIETYSGLPHRMKIVKETNKITFVNDSISTIPESTIEAVKTYKNKEITLILGGKNRKQNYDKLSSFLKKMPCVKKIMLIGETEEDIYLSLLRHNFDKKSIYKSKTLENAMKTIHKVVKTGIVLLSPSAPSYDQFKNFEERGNLFSKLA